MLDAALQEVIEEELILNERTRAGGGWQLTTRNSVEMYTVRWLFLMHLSEKAHLEWMIEPFCWRGRVGLRQPSLEPTGERVKWARGRVYGSRRPTDLV